MAPERGVIHGEEEEEGILAFDTVIFTCESISYLVVAFSISGTVKNRTHSLLTSPQLSTY